MTDPPDPASSNAAVPDPAVVRTSLPASATEAGQSSPRDFGRKYCLTCNERLLWNLWKCPRCGRPFEHDEPGSYTTSPRSFPWNFWFPGFCLATAAGVISYALVMLAGAMGMALFVAVPISFGAILGYAARTALWWKLALLGLILPTVVMGIIWIDLAGFFCGFTLGIIFLTPAACGVLLGSLLRWWLRGTKFGRRDYLPLLLLATIPYGAAWAESFFPRTAVVATVETSLTVDCTAAEAWRAITTYEEVTHEPPWLLKLALPKPISSHGSKQRPGDIVRCVYDRGVLCKQITEVVPQRRLAFKVTEQQLHFEHDVKLLGGSFEIEPDGGKTKITLVTDYEKLLRPEAVWGPIEREVIHTLHEHVLEGMRRKATKREPEPYRPPPLPATERSPTATIPRHEQSALLFASE